MFFVRCAPFPLQLIYLSIAMFAPSVALAAVIKVMSLEWFILLAGVLCTFYVGIVSKRCLPQLHPVPRAA